MHPLQATFLPPHFSVEGGKTVHKGVIQVKKKIGEKRKMTETVMNERSLPHVNSNTREHFYQPSSPKHWTNNTPTVKTDNEIRAHEKDW